MICYLLSWICLASTLTAATLPVTPQPLPPTVSPTSPCGNSSIVNWNEGATEALNQQQINYYNKIFQLQAQLKGAMLQYSMLQEGDNPDFNQLQENLRTINNLRLQMDLAGLGLQQQARTTLTPDQYRQWRAAWTPGTGYEWSILYNQTANDLSQAVALWQALQSINGTPTPARTPQPPQSSNSQNWLQQLPAQSMQRALEYSHN